jgi:DNA-binding NtrC family response regulator
MHAAFQAACFAVGLVMRVLLIEDDELVRNTLSETLIGEDIEVAGLANAEDALILLAAGQVPDVLVTDIDLGPGLNGFDLAEIARARHPEVEVILISGTTPDPGRQALRRHERFLQKPFAPDDLAAAIREAGPHDQVGP